MKRCFTCLSPLQIFGCDAAGSHQFQHQSSGAQGSWRGCLYAPLAAPKVWLLGSPGEGQPVQQHCGAQGRQDGYVAPGSRRQQTDRQSPIHLKNPAGTRGRTLGQGCGDESNHPSRGKGTGVTALPLWVQAGRVLALHSAVGTGRSLGENHFCGGISEVEREVAGCNAGQQGPEQPWLSSFQFLPKHLMCLLTVSLNV